MRVFNRVVVALLLAGLVALGVSAVIYSLDLNGYRLANLPAILGLDAFYQQLTGYIANLENRNLIPVDFVILGAVALAGLVLLIFEFKPSKPRRVRMQQGTYIARRAVEAEATQAVEQNPAVLKTHVRAKARRRPGAKVNIRADIRPGENAREVESGLREQVREYLARVGVPVSNIKLRLREPSPSETAAAPQATRVR